MSVTARRRHEGMYTIIGGLGCDKTRVEIKVKKQNVDQPTVGK